MARYYIVSDTDLDGLYRALAVRHAAWPGARIVSYADPSYLGRDRLGCVNTVATGLARAVKEVLTREVPEGSTVLFEDIPLPSDPDKAASYVDAIAEFCRHRKCIWSDHHPGDSENPYWDSLVSFVDRVVYVPSSSYRYTLRLVEELGGRVDDRVREYALYGAVSDHDPEAVRAVYAQVLAGGGHAHDPVGETVRRINLVMAVNYELIGIARRLSREHGCSWPSAEAEYIEKHLSDLVTRNSGGDPVARLRERFDTIAKLSQAGCCTKDTVFVFAWAGPGEYSVTDAVFHVETRAYPEYCAHCAGVREVEDYMVYTECCDGMRPSARPSYRQPWDCRAPPRKMLGLTRSEQPGPLFCIGPTCVYMNLRQFLHRYPSCRSTGRTWVFFQAVPEYNPDKEEMWVRVATNWISAGIAGTPVLIETTGYRVMREKYFAYSEERATENMSKFLLFTDIPDERQFFSSLARQGKSPGQAWSTQAKCRRGELAHNGLPPYTSYVLDETVPYMRLWRAFLYAAMLSQALAEAMGHPDCRSRDGDRHRCARFMECVVEKSIRILCCLDRNPHLAETEWPKPPVPVIPARRTGRRRHHGHTPATRRGIRARHRARPEAVAMEALSIDELLDEGLATPYPRDWELS